MKKQLNPAIKAHLMRGAFYLLLLIAVCAIPFALAQRNAPKRNMAVPKTGPRSQGEMANDAVPFSAAARVSNVPLRNSGVLGFHPVRVPLPPKAPQAILYDQYNNAGLNATFSGTFTDFTGFDADLADDFVVPAGQTWNVESIDADGVYFNGSGPANSFNVFIYTDSAGFPGTQVYSTTNQPWVQSGTTFTVNLSPAAVLSPGTYWIEIQANMTFAVGGQWGWTDRTVQSNNGAAWQNPGGGFGICITWGRRGDPAGCDIDPGVPDQVYRLVGTMGGLPCTPGWSAGGNFPSVGVRSVGVYFPANGKLYAMGGRSADAAGSDFTHPFEYDPTTNTWTIKSATYADNQVNNMACGVLNLDGTDYIYCVGGSAAGQTTATARVFYYDPVADSLTYLSGGDNWPGDTAGTILPGGFAVHANKLYILGGFNINVASTNEIWQFDPTAAIGAKWTQMTNTPEGVMYAPTCTINGIIYLAGASDFQGGTVVDTTNSFSFNPATNTIGSIAPIPRATGETRALAFKNPPQMWVMGGGRVAPNPSNEVDVYDPVTNSWSLGPAFTTARRNFPTDTNGTDHIWLSGGYAPATPTDSTEVFCQQGASPTPTPTASPTGCQFHVLIVYADTGVPTQLQSEVLAEPNVVSCDLFDATTGTPTL